MGSRPIMKTINGHEEGDVVSALQKSIRRGEAHDALYFAVDLDLSGKGNWCWNRLLVMASEDVGLADPDVCVRIKTLYDTYQVFKKQKNDHCPERLMLIHAVLILAHANKSRLVDTALITHYGLHEQLYRDIPDYALDAHTRRGRMRLKNDKGAGVDFFYETGAQTIPADSYEQLEMIYEEQARKFQSAGGQLPPAGDAAQQRLA